MRTFLAVAIIGLTIAAPADAAIRNFGVTSFDRVRIDGPFKVRLATGVAPFARASGSPDALDRVSIEVQGNTLVVHRSLSGWGGYTGENSGPVEVDIGTHELSSAWLNGAGTLAIDRARGLTFDLSVQGSGAAGIGQVDVDQLSVNVAGTASAWLAGRAARLSAVVRGISSLDASGLATKDATLGAEGAATVKASVANAIRIDASGPADVTLTGSPSCMLRVSGSANVTGCGSTQ